MKKKKTEVKEATTKQMSEAERVLANATKTQVKEVTKIIVAEDEVKEVTEYTVSEDEVHLFHIKYEYVQFDARTSKRLSTPQIQKINKVDFKNVERSLKEKGFEYEILHTPK